MQGQRLRTLSVKRITKNWPDNKLQRNKKNGTRKDEKYQISRIHSVQRKTVD